METFSYYKSFGIRYLQMSGTTFIEHHGSPLKSYVAKGEIEGDRLAKKYIDELVGD